MWTVFLQPFTNILLRPEHDGTDQAGLCRACVINPVVITGTVLQPEDGHALEKSRSYSKCAWCPPSLGLEKTLTLISLYLNREGH